MILLDTQVLIWWMAGSGGLSPKHRKAIEEAESDGISASAFSVWEIAMLVAKKCLELNEPVQQWLHRASSIPTLHFLPVTPQILLDSTQLPGEVHSDPADRIIIATARAHDSTLLTTDRKILHYGHVRTIGPD